MKSEESHKDLLDTSSQSLQAWISVSVILTALTLSVFAAPLVLIYCLYSLELPAYCKSLLWLDEATDLYTENSVLAVDVMKSRKMVHWNGCLIYSVYWWRRMSDSRD